MVDSTFCPRCSLPVPPGEAFCASCGAPLAGGNEGESPAGASDAREATGREPEPGPSGELQPHDPVAPPVHTPANWQVDLGSMAQPPEVPRPPEPEPTDDGADHIPGGYLPPSATYRDSGWAPPERGPAGPGEQSAGPGMSVSIGAVPFSPAAFGPPLEPVAEAPEPAPATIAPPIPAFVTPPTPRSHVAPAVQAPAAQPAATLSPRKESVQELVAFGLIASGGVVGFASLFLPWAGSSGIGIGTVATAGSPPQPNQWAWGMPAAMPLFLLTGLILGAAAGSDRARHQLPGIARLIGRVTDVILPMFLGGLYFGVGLLYATLPSQFGYGTGIFVLLVGACLLIAGSIVALCFPSVDDQVSA